ncbi:MAG TPA: transglutaminase domain-containing protein [Candidatus Sulfotelmatobacter sp.]|nr:transglutaminase domain-containing protein [Candidatus Sulfotelmatobacter sp.]
MTGSFGWTQLQGTVDIVEGSARIDLVAMLLGGGSVWLDDFSLVPLAELSLEERTARMPELAGYAAGDSAYVFDVQSVSQVGKPSAAGAGDDLVRLQVALPLSDSHQIPIGLDLWTEPASSLRSARIRRDTLGNAVAELAIDARDGARDMPAGLGRGVLLHWNARVLVLPERLTPLAHANLPAAWPEQTRQWLEPTPCAQSADSQIVRIARAIRSGSSDVADIIQRTLTTLYGRQANLLSGVATFDAVAALTYQGSCVSRANLMVALLRANGIPARMLSGIATWAGPHEVHVIVEAWTPTQGWVRVEPSRLQAPWAACMQINVSLVGRAAEFKGAEARPGGVACLPYLALVEFDRDCDDCRWVGVLNAALGAGQQATRELARSASADPEAWTAASRQARADWDGWLASSPRLNERGHLVAVADNKQLSIMFMK